MGRLTPVAATAGRISSDSALSESIKRRRTVILPTLGCSGTGGTGPRAGNALSQSVGVHYLVLSAAAEVCHACNSGVATDRSLYSMSSSSQAIKSSKYSESKDLNVVNSVSQSMGVHYFLTCLNRWLFLSMHAT